MSKIELLRLLITQRLTAAAEEIFGVFGRTIAEYEEEICRSKLEIDRQRRLLDLNRTPQISLQGGSVLSEQQDWSSALDPGDEPPPHIKVEEEEEEEEVYSDPHEAPPLTPDQTDVDFLLFHKKQDSEEPDPRPGPSDLSVDPLDPLEPPQMNGGPDGAALDVLLSEAVDSYVCALCGRSFVRRHHWTKHMQVHRKADAKVTKSYVCNICGRKLSRLDGYHKHLRIHTGEKPYACSHCGRRFSDNSNFKRHIRTHTLQTHHTQTHHTQTHHTQTHHTQTHTQS